MAQVSLKSIKKAYDSTVVVENLNLEIHDNEFMVLVGPSGCGKSTTLRMIAGLEEITAGELLIDNKIVNDLLPGDRNTAMVFQDYALYPHMSVYENIAFGLRLKKLPKDEIASRVKEASRMLDLDAYLKRKPAALSGGQRQRVAMGRAIVKRAGVFLFDEPLSNLDAKLRSKMRGEIKKFHLQTNTTTVYVTHDQLEAMTLADRLVVMKDGEIQQIGTPLEVFERPRNLFTATFIGNPAMNIFDVAIERDGNRLVAIEKSSAFKFPLPKSKSSVVESGASVKMGIRPSDIFISDDRDEIEDSWKIDGKVEMTELLGKNAFITMNIGGNECLGEVMGRVVPKIGDTVKLSFNLNHVLFFDSKSGLNLEK